MYYKKMIIGISAALAVSAASPAVVSADETMIYGLMNIPYSDFYAAEFGNSGNAYDVDAVSSATTSKWPKNGKGELFEGSYNQANEDGTGTILGVTYPVVISKEDLGILGENNYGFTLLDNEPAAYKKVELSDGRAVFSGVVDSKPETASGSSVKLSTSTVWGDYLISIENKPELGAVHGALIRTADGNTYPMRHEENIWRGELAWSSGIVTTEPHGNKLSYKNYESLMGSTINEVVFITLDGYTTVKTDTYVPIKFDGKISVESSDAGNGTVLISSFDFPDDYRKVFSVNKDGFSVSGDRISYYSAMPGEYTLTVSDEAEKYAQISTKFILSSDNVPIEYSERKLVKKAGSTDEEFENYIKNISAVTVNGKKYNASGKDSVKIILADGSIDFSAASNGDNIFDTNGSSELKIEASGYSNNIEFQIKNEAPEVTAITTDLKNNLTTVTSDVNNTASSVMKQNSTPKTGDTGSVITGMLLAVSGLSALILKKKNRR